MHSYYADRIARDGYIGLIACGCPEYAAPHNATDAVFGTNPMAYGFPTSNAEAPIVCDMATTADTRNGLLAAKHAGLAVGPHIGYDASGRQTTDPAAILEGGALRSWDGGPKGSALALLVELLTGPLVGAAVCECPNDVLCVFLRVFCTC